VKINSYHEDLPTGQRYFNLRFRFIHTILKGSDFILNVVCKNAQFVRI
jgi:hypothetical protein